MVVSTIIYIYIYIHIYYKKYGPDVREVYEIIVTEVDILVEMKPIIRPTPINKRIRFHVQYHRLTSDENVYIAIGQ